MPTTPTSTALNTTTYNFDILKVEGHKPLKLVIEPNGTSIIVTYYNEFADREISWFDSNYRLLFAQYLNPQNQETAHVQYDYLQKKIILTGINDATYPMAERAYENNGSLFHILGRFSPEPNQPFICRLTQGNLYHIQSAFQRFLICKLVGPINMFFRFKADELITIAHQTYAARHFELGIHDSTLSVFWPEIYHFWYTAEKPYRMLRYEGKNPKGETEIITLIDITEQNGSTQKKVFDTHFDPTSNPTPASK